MSAALYNNFNRDNPKEMVTQQLIDATGLTRGDQMFLTFTLTPVSVKHVGLPTTSAPSRAINTDTVKVAEGVGREEWLSPKELRFSQRTITENGYAAQMQSKKWTWSQENPLIVLERSDGTLVSLDNRRLDAALEANVERVPVRILKETDTYIDYKTSRTAQEAFDWRSSNPKTLEHGGIIPPEGLVNRPKQLPKL